MKIRILLCVISILAVGSTAVAQEEGFTPLFNGKDLSGWKTVVPEKEEAIAFSVNAEEKAIHTYAGLKAESKQGINCLYTTKEYSDFVVKLEYKWLEKRFKPRLDHDRDSGLLFHTHGNLTKIWPNCLEMQFGESDIKKTDKRYTTGDLWVIGKDVQVKNKRDGEFYKPDAELTDIGKSKGYDKSYTSIANEKPHGQWNEVTLTVRGGREAIFELNGKVVNRIQDMTYMEDGKRVPLTKGRIAIQAEYAEILFRNFRIKDMKPVVEEPKASIETTSSDD